MLSLLKILAQATVVVLTAGLLLGSAAELGHLPTPPEGPAVSPFPSNHDTTTLPVAALGSTTPRDGVTESDTANVLLSADSPPQPSGAVDSEIRQGRPADAAGSSAAPRDDATAKPPVSSDAENAPAHVTRVNGSGLLSPSETSTAQTVPPPNFTVAFIGDQGPSSDALAVLALIKSEGADMVLHQGDFDYNDNPDAWDQRITDVLGPDFPYFASIGNHDERAWTRYQQKLLDRLARIPEAQCTGDLGVNSSCEYRGLFFILSGVGVKGTAHERYIREELAQTDAVWRICSWHKNQTAMQVGEKSDETGWGVYEACREGGAIIATAHEHSYERTKTLISIESQIVDPEWPHPRELRLAPGSSFVFVSGLGGHSIREQRRCLPSTPPYGCKGEWASIYSSSQGAAPGALFCSFNFSAQPDKARCYFKDIGGVVPDEFTVISFFAQVPQQAAVTVESVMGF